MSVTIDPWLDADLRNWARWCRSGPLPHPLPDSKAASAEGRYLSPSDLGEEPEPRAPAPIAWRAEVVQRVYLHRLTDEERWALKWRYVRRVDDREAMRRMKVTRVRHERLLLDAARAVARAFQSLN